MAFISREFLNTTTTNVFPLLIQAIKDAGWEEVYNVSATSVVLRTNCEDGLGPWVYINLSIVSSSIVIRGYQHWSGTTGYCIFPSSNTQVFPSTATQFRIYVTKNFIMQDIGYGGIFIPRSPLRFTHTCSHSITGASSVQLTLSGVSNLRIGFKYNIYGIAGEGQQEIEVTAVDRINKIITVTGCTNNYAIGAIVGDFILSCIIRTGSYWVDQFAYNRVGTTNITSTNVSFTGKNGTEGAPYSHDSNYTLESLILKSSNRYLGDVSSKYIKYAKSITSGDVCYLVNSDDPIVDSVPTSFDSYSLTDTTKNWEIDALIGKCVLFISGTGSGYSRYIIGNTSNTLTFRTILPTITTATGYRIVDAVYRSVAFDSTAVIREEF